VRLNLLVIRELLGEQVFISVALLHAVPWLKLWRRLEHRRLVLGSESCELLFNIVTIDGIFSKYLDFHLAPLGQVDHAQLVQDVLDLLISALVVVQELLHVHEGVAQLRIVDQRELVVVLEDERQVFSDLVVVQLNVFVYLLHYSLEAIRQ